jgi:hypothetical protein
MVVQTDGWREGERWKIITLDRKRVILMPLLRVIIKDKKLGMLREGGRWFWPG